MGPTWWPESESQPALAAALGHLAVHDWPESTGRGLCLIGPAPLLPGAPVLALPASLLVTRQTVAASLGSAEDALRGSAFDALSDIQCLALFLARGPAAAPAWTWYFNSLPRPAETLAAAHSVPPDCLPFVVQEKLQRQAKTIDFDLAAIAPWVFSEDISRDALLHAWFLVNTRCVTLPPPAPYRVALAPFLDMLNHSPHATTTTRFDDAYTLLAGPSDTFHPGDQVFIHYGPHSNAELFVEYGFVVPGNPFNFEVLDDCVPGLLGGDPALSAMIRDEGLAQDVRLTLTCISPKLLCLLRLLHVPLGNAAALSAWRRNQDGLSLSLGPRNEAAAWASFDALVAAKRAVVTRALAAVLDVGRVPNCPPWHKHLPALELLHRESLVILDAMATVGPETRAYIEREERSASGRASSRRSK